MLNAASGARIVPYRYAPAVSAAVSVRWTGCTILKQVPLPGAETTEMSPPSISMIVRQMESPSPTPFALESVL